MGGVAKKYSQSKFQFHGRGCKKALAIQVSVSWAGLQKSTRNPSFSFMGGVAKKFVRKLKTWM
jgi:hypothetical protein